MEQHASNTAKCKEQGISSCLLEEGSCLLECSDTEKYLGVMVDKQFNLSSQHDAAA